MNYVLMHEHMSIDLSKEKQDSDACKICLEETIAEIKQLYDYGVRTILDVTTIGMGRDVAFMKKIEKATGVCILPSTGFYKEPFLPAIVYEESKEELAEIMIKELTLGCDKTSKKAVCIGEIGTSKEKMTSMEKKVFDAAILAAKHCGAILSTHTTLGTFALEQAQYLVEHGILPNRIIIGHIALCKDLNKIREVLNTGVNIAFDTIGKTSYISDLKQAEILLVLQNENQLDKVVLSLDLTRLSHMKSKGGHGYTYLFEVFLPLLRKMGMKESSINKMLVDNPRRLLEERN